MNAKRKIELSKDDMLIYFEEINRRLAAEGKHGEITMTGGATMALVYNARNSTQDIDAIFQPKEDMRKIIKDVASDYELEGDWLNDGSKGFVTPQMNFQKVLTLSNLTVSSVDAEGMLAVNHPPPKRRGLATTLWYNGASLPHLAYRFVDILIQNIDFDSGVTSRGC